MNIAHNESPKILTIIPLGYRALYWDGVSLPSLELIACIRWPSDRAR
jgi:hypothetical protein